MTNEEAINTLKSLKQYYNDKNEDSYVCFDDEDNESIDMAIQALEQQPCEDCISRQAAIDFIIDNYGLKCSSLTNGIRDYLPPVTPQQKIGHWNRVVDKAGHWVWECDKCGWQQQFNTNYCPDCGAKMED